MKNSSKFTTSPSLDELVKNREELNKFLGSIYVMEDYSYTTNYYDVYRQENNFSKIDEKYLSKMGFDYKSRVEKLKQAIEVNQKFLTVISECYRPPDKFYFDNKITDEEVQKAAYDISSFLNYGVFLYIARDWSVNCKTEREEHYLPIIKEVEKLVPKSDLNNKTKKKILIPGAALCRLGYELAIRGYDIDLNEYNYLNIILSDYMINHSKKEMFTYQPLIRTFSNYLNENDVFREYKFPDITPDLSGEEKGKMHLLAGDFTKVYEGVKEEYDCVITCFFIDTAKIIFEYIDIIQRVLKKGGIWINFGPLSYHWVGYDNIPSVELPYDKLKEVIINFGFEYIFEDTSKIMNYCYIENYMKNDYYQCIFFSARKK